MTSSDVFVSYAREDVAFVRELYEALRKLGREPWVDWKGIPPTGRWREDIESAIISATTFAFVVTSHSLASRECGWESPVRHRASQAIDPAH